MTKEELLQIPFYIEDISGSENTVSITKLNTSTRTLNIEYSTDGITWTTKTMNSDTTANTFTCPANGKLYLRGVNKYGWADYLHNYNSITCSGNHNVGGNILSLLYGSEFIDKTSFPAPSTSGRELIYLFYNNTNLVNAQDLQLPTTTLTYNCYNSMFKGCSSLTTAPSILPATTLADNCYTSMFNGCSSLTTAPELPATTLTSQCYFQMFEGCSSLTTTPELPATTLASSCYNRMFYGCSNLTTASSILPATTLASSCYNNMFYGCSSLMTAPELPATTLAGNCYENMFNGCSSLTTAPELPATTLASSCYNMMFNGCSSLTTAPELPATTLTEYCYFNMFAGCSKLTTTPELPATTLATQCYKNMFGDCTSLTTPPVLLATTLVDRCYSYMFNGCSSLTTAPELPATKLAIFCYEYMFQGCSSLTTPPALPATTLVYYCYRGIFQNCTSLTTAPELLATTLASGCYNSMFNGCNNLNYIKADFIDYSNDNNQFTNWVQGVAEEGTFIMNSEATYKPVDIRGVDGIPEGWNVKIDKYFKITDVSGEDNLLTITKSSAEAPEISLEYSYDKQSWNTVTFTELVSNIELPANGVIYLRGDNDSLATSVENYHSITCSGNYTISDNIMTLLNFDVFELITELTNGFEFTNLFKDSTTLVNVNKLKLPVATLATSCYQGMFSGCTQLTETPELPATTLATSCYQDMFSGCTGLTKSPVLNTTTLATSCYQGMFSGCTQLTETPELPATTLATSCYQGMFSGCTGLTKSATLPATTLATSCYQGMFSNCSKLNYIKAEFVDYSNDNNEFTSWVNGVSSTGTFITNLNPNYIPDNIRGIDGIPEGWKVTIDFIKAPFYIEDISGSTNTVTIKKNSSSAPTLNIEYSTDGVTWYTKTMNSSTTANTFTIPANGKLYLRGKNNYWGSGKSGYVDTYDNIITCSGKHNVCGNIMSLLYASGFENQTGFTYLTDKYIFHNLFYNNKTLINAQDLQLPATRLTPYCYYEMFSGCSSLTTAPALPATETANWCYREMFNGCSSLTTAPELPATTLTTYCYSYMFQGCNKINFIKANFIENTNYSNYALTGWLEGVADEGTFVYNPEATYNPELIIPNGWIAYKSNQRGVNVISNNNILGTVTGSGICTIGETVTLTAVPTYKGKFVSWNDGNTELTRTIEITEVLLYETTYTATFEEVPGIYFINESENTNTLTVTNTDKYLQYSTDKITWSDIVEGTTTIEFKNNIIVKGVNTSLDGVNFQNSEITKVEGRLSSLLYSDDVNTMGNVISEDSTNTFKGLFKNNTNLVDISELVLPENTVEGCYQEMFSGCTSLETVPTLPATTLSTSCYQEMFSGCTELTKAPALPATTLSTSCYESMFSGCTGLEKAPALNATTLAESCYESMFSGCTGLEKAPNLPAYTLATGCYSSMFQGCSNLKQITALFIEFSNENNVFTNNWVDGVAEEGLFIYNQKATYNPEEFRGVDGIPTGWNVKDNNNNYFYIEDVSGQFNTIGITLDNASCYMYNDLDSSTFERWNHLNVEYSYDGERWIPLNIFEEFKKTGFPMVQIHISPNTKVYLRGENKGWNSFVNNVEFFEQEFGITYQDMIGQEFFMWYSWGYDIPCPINTILFMNKVKIGGNILTLKYSENIPSTITSEDMEYSFMNLFNPDIINGVYEPGPNYSHGMNFVVDASELILPNVVGSDCYNRMFYCCSLLTKTPELPAMELAPYCYREMFDDCTSLIKTPELPATTLADGCYFGMFKGCTNLIKAPSVLPATTLAEDCCNYMFQYCTSLTTAPELPATTLASNCYKNMFQYCSNLVKASSILPATTLADGCYNQMFASCTSLTKAPELPATTLAEYCYSGMFDGCSKLNYIKADFIEYSNANGEFYYWVSGVSPTGTFVMNPEATYNPEDILGDNGIPYGWLMKGITYGVEFKPLDDELTITISRQGELQNHISLRYSTDFVNWIDITERDLTCKINVGYYGMVLVGDNASLEGIHIEGNAPYSMKGNIMCLLLGENGTEKECKFAEGSNKNFKNLFLGDENLVDISELVFPENTIDKCYQHMFTGCRNINKLPKLPAVNLTDHCYHGMFMGCDNLIRVNLPEAYLAPYAYSNMFLGSDNLSSVTVTYKEDVDNTHYKGWLRGVSIDGHFNYNYTEEVDDNKIITSYQVPSSWSVNYRDPNVVNDNFYIEDISGEENIVIIKKNNVDAPTLNLEYSYDQYEWFTATMNEDMIINIFTCPANGKIYFRGYNDRCGYNYFGMYNSISCTGLHNVGGNITSLLDGENFANYNDFASSNDIFSHLFQNNITLVNAKDLVLRTTELVDGCYADMFNGCSSLITAPALPATTLANYCYSGMFSGCTSLTEAPALPATELANNCYQYMFNGCTDLTVAPELPATYLYDYCYQYMFQGCSSLTAAPELPATDLAPWCYQYMFNDCVSMTTGPSELPATDLVEGCYSDIFNGCRSLTVAPALPATNLATKCYSGMFAGCSSLTVAPELPATELAYNCYQYMFQNCTSLTEAPALPATELSDYCYQYMFQNCTSLTTTPELPAESLSMYCYQNMFNACTGLTTVSELPATNLAQGCYQNMFALCSSLTEAPELPAEYLVDACYADMFNGCTSLTKAPELPSTNIAQYCYSGMFSGCTSLTEAPSILPAEYLSNNCYQFMFNGCTSLTVAPELPSIYLYDWCYQYMFQNCTSLTVAPELPATDLYMGCYQGMFNGCSSLNYIKADFTYHTYYDYIFTNWVNGVADEGTFVMNANANYYPEDVRGVDGIPENWNVVTA